MKNTKVKLADNLYRYCSQRGVWTYTVTAIVEELDTKLARLSCEQCQGSCEGREIYVDAFTLKFSRSSNHAGDSDVWHARMSENYYLTKREALEEMYDTLIENQCKEIERNEAAIRVAQARIRELQEKAKEALTPPNSK